LEKASSWEPWLVPVIPASQEAEVRKIMVQSQPGQIVLKPIEKTQHKRGMV
jgi:hypothetical protein